MASLVGKAQEDDDTFWSHSIWSEAGGGFSSRGSRKRRREDGGESSSSSGSEGGSGGEDSASDGEGSFRMSDEDSAAAVDQFDSDFDESESDEDEDGHDEVEEEQELRAEERREAASKRKKNQRLGAAPLKSSSAGRELMKKRTGKMTRRGPLGEGWNEGLVLNWPPQPPGGAALGAAKLAAAAPSQAKILDPKLMAIPGAHPDQSIPPATQTRPQKNQSQPTSHIDTKQIAKQPPRPPPIRHLRPGAAPMPIIKPTSAKLKQQRQTATVERKKAPRRQLTQEELILECIKSTETENAKWLIGRKRSKQEVAQSEKAAGAKKSSLNQKPISRFYSRRGCPNTLTFMDMDHLPEVLTRRHATAGNLGQSSITRASPKRRRLDSITSETSASVPNAEKSHEKCIITGKIARYRDPKTMLGYHDLDAYKELRRRVESGELNISQNRRRISSGSNSNRAIGQRNGSGADATIFPFAYDQPTIVAEFKSNRRPNVVKVMVTQGGVPVSPGSGMRLPSEFPLGEQPSMSEGSSRGISPLPLPSIERIENSPSKLGDISRFLMGRMETSSGVRTAEFADANSTVDVTRRIASNQAHTEEPTAPASSASSESRLSKSGAAGITDDAGKDNRENYAAKPQMTVSSNATETVMMLGTNGKVETDNNGGSNEKTNNTLPPSKDISRKGGDGSSNKNIVPEVTASNDKRTTIEAN